MVCGREGCDIHGPLWTGSTLGCVFFWQLRGLSRLPILSLGLFGVDTSFRIPDTLTKSSLGSILKVAFCTGSFILAPRMKIATAPRASRVLFVMRQSNKFAYFWQNPCCTGHTQSEHMSRWFGASAYNRRFA